MAKGDRNLGWPGFFRVFAVLCAIMLLLAQSWQELAEPGSGAWRTLWVYEGLTCWAVPALFMLWGMSALEEGRTQASAALLGLSLPAVGLLVFWGAVYAAACRLLEGGGFTLGALADILLAVARGDAYPHLWLLYPLIGLYLVHPVLQRFASSASRGELRYFLGLCFVFASLLPMCSALWPNSALAGLLERLRVHLTLGWVGCYVGGWYLRQFTISRAAEYILYVLGGAGLAAAVLPPELSVLQPELLRQYLAPNVVLTAAAFCVLFRYVLGVSEERSRRRVVNGIGACAFGIYLSHQLWYLAFRWFGFAPLDFPPALSVPVLAVVLFLLSLPLAWLVFLIPGLGPRLT